MAMSPRERKAAQRSRTDGYAKSREADWKKRGITNATYQKYLDMLEQQNHQCAICGCHINGNSHLDHNHVTGKIRGLLCPICNMALGNLEPYINHVQAYLQLSDDMAEVNQHSFTDQNGLQVHNGEMYGINEQGELYAIEPIVPFHPSEY